MWKRWWAWNLKATVETESCRTRSDRIIGEMIRARRTRFAGRPRVQRVPAPEHPGCTLPLPAPAPWAPPPGGDGGAVSPEDSPWRIRIAVSGDNLRRRCLWPAQLRAQGPTGLEPQVWSSLYDPAGRPVVSWRRAPGLWRRASACTGRPLLWPSPHSRNDWTSCVVEESTPFSVIRFETTHMLLCQAVEL